MNLLRMVRVISLRMQALNAFHPAQGWTGHATQLDLDSAMDVQPRNWTSCMQVPASWQGSRA